MELCCRVTICKIGVDVMPVRWQAGMDNPKWTNGNWNLGKFKINSLVGQQSDLACGMERYRLDKVGLSFTHSKGSGIPPNFCALYSTTSDSEDDLDLVMIKLKYFLIS